ncbi:hypothetical protein [Segatella copri]|uniref:hypothetical protein n=1 Tax=Segatella copri TaxID=165179 RepID=UPI001933F8AB|nr:hypothetical protein [Segatella copri]MBM0144218.1 hypothetical protein [Segatella copri]
MKQARKSGESFEKKMVGYIKFPPSWGKITTITKSFSISVLHKKSKVASFLAPVRPLGDDWREYCSYPQVPFPSVIPPAVIESWPPPGTGGYLRNLSAL